MLDNTRAKEEEYTSKEGGYETLGQVLQGEI
jgi:hypothetical protein